MRNVKYSICIPAYKAKFLESCIQSVLSQTFTSFELIILNDGSPENLREIVKKFDDERIKYFENEKNVGAIDVVNNWNKCLELANGEYLIMIGDDDMLTSVFLETYNKLIGKYPNCNVYHCRSLIIDENNKPIELTNIRPEHESVYDSIIERINGRIFFIGDYLFHKGNLQKNGGFIYLPLAWGTDDLTSFTAAIKNGIVHTNEVIFYYRRSRYTISSTGNVDMKMIAISNQKRWFADFLKSKPENEVDKILWQTIKNNIDIYIKKLQIRTIYSSLAEGSSNIFHWFVNRKKNNISTPELLYAILLSFKEKNKEKK